VRADWASLFQKDPALFDPSETPEAKPESERAAFIEELKAGSRLALLSASSSAPALRR